MTIQDIKTAITQLSKEDYEEILSWAAGDERDRRIAAPAVEKAKQEAESDTATKIAHQIAEEHPELVEKPAVQTGDGIRGWEPWHPLKTSTHYYYGDKTRHNGKVWRDVLDPTKKKLNVWEPGAQGIDERYWVEETEPETTETSETPETTQPEATKPETDSEPENPDKPGEEAGDTTPEPAAPEVPEWQPNLNVKPGERYTFQGSTYEVVQGHSTQAGWEPSAVPALWKKR